MDKNTRADVDEAVRTLAKATKAATKKKTP